MQVWGSHGDIRPMLALAEGLAAADHEVMLVMTSVDGASNDLAVSHDGLTVKSLASPVVPNKAELARIENAIFSQANPVKQVRGILDGLFLPVESVMYGESERLCRENDVVIGHFFHYPLHVAARKNDTPYVSVTLVHSALPSAYRPPVGLPNLGRIGNRLSWSLIRMIMNTQLKVFPDHLLKAQGLPPAEDLITDVWASRLLNLIAVSPRLCSVQRDWPEANQVCGFLDSPPLAIEGEISRELDAFLDAGEPPVFMTFGSAMASDIDAQRQSIVVMTQSARLAGCRAIIVASRWKACGFEQEGDIHYVDAVPYAAVFPRCSAVVQHGGAGTTHTALRAGVPSIVVAHMAEQEFWAKELVRIGVSPGFLRFRNVAPEPLAALIRQTVGSERMRLMAKSVGEKMKHENGVQNAVKLINDRLR